MFNEVSLSFGTELVIALYLDNSYSMYISQVAQLPDKGRVVMETADYYGFVM